MLCNKGLGGRQPLHYRWGIRMKRQFGGFDREQGVVVNTARISKLSVLLKGEG